MDSLRPADSPRLNGENVEHIRALTETDAPLPPILVHRPTMRVIDGMHRLRATIARGAETIEVCFFDGTEDSAFTLAVEANIAHGLPLSLADREAAASRLLVAHPERSDRAIAASTGLNPKTVNAIRSRTPGNPQGAATRIGLDGRTRPLSSAEGRELASEMLANQPDRPLREIAKLAGISLGTAHDVRERVRRGDNPVPARQRATEPTAPTQPTEPARPTGPTQPTEPARPTGPTQPTEPARPTGPTRPTESAGPTEPTQPARLTGPAGSTQPTEPARPTGSTQPAQPAQPTGPAEPTQPARPAEPARTTGPLADRPHTAGVTTAQDRLSMLQNLRRDPSIRFNEGGRQLVKWLDAHAGALEEWTCLAKSVPPHYMEAMVKLARGCAESWSEFAEHLERRGRTSA